MSLANKITFSRIILAPVFFIVFLLPVKDVWTVPVLWFIFIVAELTDMLDGMAARKQNEVSDFGKLFDPFADTLMQLTCFFCFVIDGIFPAVLFLLVIYREFSILFIRNLMLKRGITLGARMSGKIKTVFYIFAGGAALLTDSLQRLAVFIEDHLPRFAVFVDHLPLFKTGTLIIFIISVVISIVSFIDYMMIFKNNK
ncbi:MAG: CDP-diacylglycerol--glycerol-3-phosphate 3-phosphatidyltransferase [Treponema sp.]|jgi:CDP-diacylglycerol--glycerol-3-phosphate 3-phosphatidyltransferase|nr:CDP-diacylglycerol--glycerol-3-phosphate 3-phosphatidyltransferase [Treponema sp.]